MTDVLDAGADTTGAEVEKELIADRETLLKHIRKVNYFYDSPGSMNDYILLLLYDLDRGRIEDLVLIHLKKSRGVSSKMLKETFGNAPKAQMDSS